MTAGSLARWPGCVLKFGIKSNLNLCFFVRQVPGGGPEQRESGKTVFYPQLVIRGENYSAEGGLA